ncbi:voltage-gated potassium channel [Noviherbaspirillum humi]|uniref:Voltage-gated potassium channel n=1 Tax=Noviherbaspirillum humi TaxID=1688639 RepID=A0A239LPL5_9BURK|nr:ion transporter [Noviherbaspirillum humi]SNT32391.1 voltage-gated potassium channel [Noviherbaspirillum humi]
MKKSTSDPLPAPNPPPDYGRPEGGLRRRLYAIIFEANTPAGRLFDLVLVGAILASIFVVMMDTVPSYSARYGTAINFLEWGFTALFTIEYLLRIYCVRHPLRYATSFYGIIDFLSILPTYLALFMPEAHFLMEVRVLRLLRIFRILKLTMYVAEYQMLGEALNASKRKILVFIFFVLMVVLLMGTVMYVVEGPENGFDSIPRSIYWAIVTLTTVGYGDMTPKTDIGRMIASLMMLLGWGTLAVPTGIVTAEMTSRRGRAAPARACPNCRSEGHDSHARFCKDCGAPLSS